MAKRTEKVYNKVMKNPRLTLLSRIKATMAMGQWAGFFAAWMLILDLCFSFLWEWIHPPEWIEQAEDFDYDMYKKNKEAFGDHKFRVDYEKSEKERDTSKDSLVKKGKYMTCHLRNGKKKYSMNSMK